MGLGMGRRSRARASWGCGHQPAATSALSGFLFISSTTPSTRPTYDLLAVPAARGWSV